MKGKPWLNPEVLLQRRHKCDHRPAEKTICNVPVLGRMLQTPRWTLIYRIDSCKHKGGSAVSYDSNETHTIPPLTSEAAKNRDDDSALIVTVFGVHVLHRAVTVMWIRMDWSRKVADDIVLFVYYLFRFSFLSSITKKPLISTLFSHLDRQAPSKSFGASKGRGKKVVMEIQWLAKLLEPIQKTRNGFVGGGGKRNYTTMGKLGF
ncbi:hypothetical protein F5I97DRAFT_1829692 [Phlebopus sp. FC_14]|nr:hypothetical protein F5I97DRAFT_1829692 [Phlebopus sp. FC_14]